jgi:hypothetical protein
MHEFMGPNQRLLGGPPGGGEAHFAERRRRTFSRRQTGIALDPRLTPYTSRLRVGANARQPGTSRPHGLHNGATAKEKRHYHGDARQDDRATKGLRCLVEVVLGAGVDGPVSECIDIPRDIHDRPTNGKGPDDEKQQIHDFAHPEQMGPGPQSQGAVEDRQIDWRIGAESQQPQASARAGPSLTLAAAGIRYRICETEY